MELPRVNLRKEGEDTTKKMLNMNVHGEKREEGGGPKRDGRTTAGMV